ncbi:MAG TPA: UvrD-helicase domain-containing protein [Puia sp.]|jgi:DNA helicase-2/ATP-dependent DNA helicase PcrA|nr:UvrD-helicase domain-containing protein [Puia sp.]
MTDTIHTAIAQSASGFVEAPAGCGKTEAIVTTVKDFCTAPQLILTHTNAGVQALTQRLRYFQVPSSRYHVDTISGWAWNWVRRYPRNSHYAASTDIADWNAVYPAMTLLLDQHHVRSVVIHSYAGVIVDEYQDCTTAMHQLILKLKELLPCRVLGDPLQGIFGFRGQPLVSWPAVTRDFSFNLGTLDTPFRWIKAGNEPLGQWLLQARPHFLANTEPDYRRAPITRLQTEFKYLSSTLIRLTHETTGRICIIGPKARDLPAAILTTLVNHKYKIIESNELSTVKTFIGSYAAGETGQRTSISEFVANCYSGLGTEKTFIEKLIRGETQRPSIAARKWLAEKRKIGLSPPFLLDLFDYLDEYATIPCKLSDSLSALKCILEEHIRTETSLLNLYAEEVAARKHQNRSQQFRCVGSTLLVKGLEFDHVIIVRSANWPRNWGTYKDLYVALTRGSKTVTLIDVE